MLTTNAGPTMRSNRGETSAERRKMSMLASVPERVQDDTEATDGAINDGEGHDPAEGIHLDPLRPIECDIHSHSTYPTAIQIARLR